MITIKNVIHHKINKTKPREKTHQEIKAYQIEIQKTHFKWMEKSILQKENDCKKYIRTNFKNSRTRNSKVTEKYEHFKIWAFFPIIKFHENTYQLQIVTAKKTSDAKLSSFK